MLTARSTFTSLSVNSLAEAKAFYVGLLDFTVVDDSMGLSLQLPGDANVFIYEKEGHVPADFTILNFVVDDIDATIDHLTSHHGITMERYDSLPALQDERGILRGRASGDGPDIAWFKDPAGNILSVVQQ